MAGKLSSFLKSDVLLGTKNYKIWVLKAQSFPIIEGLEAII